MNTPQSPAMVEVDRRHAELIDVLRGYSVLAAPGALAQQLNWAADVISELVRDMQEDLRDRKEADEMLRQIGGTLSNQTEFTGSYAEIVVKILAALAAERAEVVRMREENEKLRAALGKYANVFNWDVDDRGIRRVWLEPESTTPTAYNGFESARAALATPTQGEQG